MNGKFSALYSRYVIDGVLMEMTPADMIEECMRGGGLEHSEPAGEVVDESVDPPFKAARNLPSDIDSCLSEVLSEEVESRTSHDSVPPFSEKNYMKLLVAEALIDAIWKDGAASVEEMSLSLDWTWNEEPIGNMASFYSGVESLTRYLFDLDVAVAGASCTSGTCDSLKVRAFPTEEGLPASGDKPLQRDASSWLVYVPFDTAAYRLGGSLLEHALGSNGDGFQDLSDPCYFSDCYEVVRELVEDSVALSGITVGRGGLLAALRHLLDRGERPSGAEINLTGIMSSYSEKDPMRVLFSEMPGVILQISDEDFDYIDAQFLLQDVAYFPIGHPDFSTGSITVREDDRSGISAILESLARGQAAEGED